MDKTPLIELPEYWREHIRHLRIERAALRRQVERPLPPGLHEKLRVLRAENAKMRRERNEVRAELAALRDEHS